MTPYTKIYEAFLSKETEDEWAGWEDIYVKADMETLLLSALPYIKFPRKDLENRNDCEGYFYDDLDNEEIQLISTYMKIEWLNRSLLTWDNIRPMYDEADFSPGNTISQLIKLQNREEEKAARLESTYYRSRKGKPFHYRKLAN